MMTELPSLPHSEVEKPAPPQPMDAVSDVKDSPVVRAETFSHVLDEYWFEKDGKPRLKEACDEYFRPYREDGDSFRAMLEGPDSAPTMLESVRDAYIVYADRIDDREWQDRAPTEDHLKEFLSQSVASSLEALDVQLKRDDLDPEVGIRMRNNALYVVSEALDTALPENRLKLESWIDAHLDDIAQLDPAHYDSDGRGDGTPLLALKNMLGRVEHAETFDRLSGRIQDIYRNCTSSNRDEIVYAGIERPLLEMLPSRFRFHDRIAKSVAGRIGLDQNIIDKWKESMTYAGKDPRGEALYRPGYLENIDAALALEMKSKGSSEKLFKDFGVANFSRYNREMLLRQLEKADEDVKYGLVVYPEADWNGAFSQNQQVLAEMAIKLRMGGLETRVIETGSQRELARRLVMLDKKYAPAGNKISFAVIGGHGTESSVSFGTKGEYSSPPPLPEQENYLAKLEDWEKRAFTSDSGKFTTSDISEGVGIKRAAREFFDENAPVVLVSCSTGREEGIAEASSGEFGFDVSAPNVPTNVEKIDVFFDEANTPVFAVKYGGDAETHRYAAGEKVKAEN